MAIKSKKPKPIKKLEKAIPKKPAVKPQDKPKPKTKVVAKPVVKSPAKAPSRTKKKPLVRKLPPPKPKKIPKLVAEPAAEKPKKGAGRKKLEKITIKERKLIRAQLDGDTLGKAAKKAGLNRNYASVVMNKPQVKERFTELLDQAGLSDYYLSDKIKALAESKETKFFAHNGIVLDQKKIPALEVQRKTIELACKLKGHMAERVEQDINVNLLARLFMIPCKPTLEEWTPDG